MDFVGDEPGMGWPLGKGGGCQEEGIFLVAFLLAEVQVLQTVSAFAAVFCEVFVLKVLLWLQVTYARVSALG